MTDRSRMEALLQATQDRYMKLVADGISADKENFWLGKIAGIRACLSFMELTT